MKNEEDILEEWINHYKLFGVTKIFIIDDESSDNSVDICKRHGDFVEVETIKNLPKIDGRQAKAFNKYFSKLFNYNNFALICDVDEFAFTLKHNSLLEYCKEYAGISQIKIPRYVFGPNENLKQPKSLIKSCFYRANENEDLLGKSIVKLDKIKWFHVHKCGIQGKEIFANLNEIRINHYIYQSKEHMLKRFLRGGGNWGRRPLKLEEAINMTDKRFKGRHFHKVKDTTLIEIYEKITNKSYCIKQF